MKRAVSACAAAVAVALAVVAAASAARGSVGAVARAVAAIEAKYEERSSETSIGTPGYNIVYGLQHLKAKEYDGAALQFRQALGLDPKHPLAQFLLGDALAGLGRKAEAKAAWGRAVQLEPQYAEDAAARAGDGSPGADAGPVDAPPKGAEPPPRSIAAWVKALERAYDNDEPETAIGKPGYATIYGIQALETRNYESAASWFRQALGLDKDDPLAQALLGDAQAGLGRIAAARAAYSRARLLAPTIAADLDARIARLAKAKPAQAPKAKPARPTKPAAAADAPRAGGTLELGTYACRYHYVTGSVGAYEFHQDYKGALVLAPGGSYTWRGEAGRYAYAAGSGAIRWTSGYFATQPTTGVFRRNEKTAQIDLRLKTSSGGLDWICGKNLS